MKYHLISYHVKSLKEKLIKVIKDHHLKKCNALLVNKCVQDGIHNKPNNLTKNSANFDLTDQEVEILNFGLIDFILLRLKESQMISIMKDF